MSARINANISLYNIKKGTDAAKFCMNIFLSDVNATIQSEKFFMLEDTIIEILQYAKDNAIELTEPSIDRLKEGFKNINAVLFSKILYFLIPYLTLDQYMEILPSPNNSEEEGEFAVDWEIQYKELEAEKNKLDEEINKLQEEITSLKKSHTEKNQKITNLIKNCVESKDVVATKLVVTEFNEYVNNLDIEDKLTPLIRASFLELYDIAKILIENGANVNKIGGPNRRAPLHNCYTNKSFEVFDLLVENGANLDLLDKHRNTPANVYRLKKNFTLFEHAEDYIKNKQ